jgi:hypothetical protein
MARHTRFSVLRHMASQDFGSRVVTLESYTAPRLVHRLSARRHMRHKPSQLSDPASVTSVTPPLEGVCAVTPVTVITFLSKKKEP